MGFHLNVHCDFKLLDSSVSCQVLCRRGKKYKYFVHHIEAESLDLAGFKNS